jgi:hypothetical protein
MRSVKVWRAICRLVVRSRSAALLAAEMSGTQGPRGEDNAPAAEMRRSLSQPVLMHFTSTPR